MHCTFAMDKDKVVNLRKMIKLEENPTGQRLRSLRLPRDLSLGGTKSNKKVFTPNLNVVRNKEKTKDFIKKTEPGKKERRNDKHNNRLNENGERFVQSTGIFSEGTAGSGIKKCFSINRRNNVKENDSGVNMSMPTIKKNVWKVNKKNEENILDELMDDKEDIDEKLPFQPVIWNSQCLSDIKAVKTEIKKDIKSEFDKDSTVHPTKQVKLETLNSSSLPIEFENEDFHNDHNPSLTLWSLPDSFAGKGLSDDPNCKKLFDYCLSDMLEGHIGKLIIRKSGKIEVLIGRVKYDLESTDLESCSEEIVSLHIEDNNESKAAVLGQVQKRFLVNPNWETLLS